MCHGPWTYCSPSPASRTSATASTPAPDASSFIERVIADVPASRVEATPDAAQSADRIAREAARNAAMVSASLALPPGPLGMLTVLPDLFVIWKIQRQLVADIFALHGRTVELTRTHMLYCLFRHAASHAARVGHRHLRRYAASDPPSHRVRLLSANLIRHLARLGF